MADPHRRLAPIVRLAPAKLNLTLAVVGVRADGYHELHSVMAALALADRISVAPSAAAADSVHVVGADVGPPERNLVLRAIAEARSALGRGAAGVTRAPALAARLEKHIPVAAGLGGGSSDGAAALDAALECWAQELDVERRLQIALRLGSDVPFFLQGGAAVVGGRGESVTPLPALRSDSPGVLLVTPAVTVSTADVYAAFDAGARSPDPGATHATSRHLAEEWTGGLDAGRLFQRAGVLAPANDLLRATALVAPDVVAARRALVRLLGRPVGQSGSGPTCWVLYPSLGEARAAAGLLTEALGDGRIRLPGSGEPFVTATTIVAGGPAAAGASGTAVAAPGSSSRPVPLTDGRPGE